MILKETLVQLVRMHQRHLVLLVTSCSCSPWNGLVARSVGWGATQREPGSSNDRHRVGVCNDTIVTLLTK